jgi:hypothetical protein
MLNNDALVSALDTIAYVLCRKARVVSPSQECATIRGIPCAVYSDTSTLYRLVVLLQAPMKNVGATSLTSVRITLIVTESGTAAVPAPTSTLGFAPALAVTENDRGALP